MFRNENKHHEDENIYQTFQHILFTKPTRQSVAYVEIDVFDF